MVKTTIDIDNDLWRIVKIRADKEDVTYTRSLERTLREFIKDHGEEYGYPIKEAEEGG